MAILPLSDRNKRKLLPINALSMGFELEHFILNWLEICKKNLVKI